MITQLNQLKQQIQKERQELQKNTQKAKKQQNDKHQYPLTKGQQKIILSKEVNQRLLKAEEEKIKFEAQKELIQGIYRKYTKYSVGRRNETTIDDQQELILNQRITENLNKLFQSNEQQ